MTDIPKICDLYDLTHTMAEPMLRDLEYPYEALPKIGEFIKECFSTLDDSYEKVADDVYIAKDAKIWNGATIVDPTIIGHKTEVRPGAFIRGNVLVGDGAVIGNSTELKNAIIFDGAQLPHYNYVGDSIIGYKGHLGAGAITSNVKGDKSLVVIKDGEHKISTKRKKVGAMLGDFAEIGCGCVLNPGTVVGARTQVYPLTSVRGVLPADSICKDAHTVVAKHTL